MTTNTTRILICSTQYPGFGGAATNTYALFKSISATSKCCIFFDATKSADNDPYKISSSHGTILRISPSDMKNETLAETWRKKVESCLHGTPDIIICKNYLSPIYCRRMWPTSDSIVYASSGISHLELFNLDITAQQIILGNHNIPENKDETEAIIKSNLVVINSPLSMKIYQKLYQQYTFKIFPYVVDTSAINVTELVNYNKSITTDKLNTNRPYDIIITASILTRKEKNNKFLLKLLASPTYDKYTKLIIGDGCEMFNHVPNSTILKRLPHSDLIKYMCQSKILLYPSLIDASPNTVREAINCNCLVLMSNNIGFYELFPKYCVCGSFDLAEWASKLDYLLSNYAKTNKISIDFSKYKSFSAFLEYFL